MPMHFQLCFKHMEIDFQYAMGSTSQPRNTLSSILCHRNTSEYMALVLKEWEMADREATAGRWIRIYYATSKGNSQRAGYSSHMHDVRLHYCGDEERRIAFFFPKWNCLCESAEYSWVFIIAIVCVPSKVSFREFCLYAEDGESYVDNVKEITKRLVESYEEESFLSYFTRCAEHMEVDYQLLYVSKELSANNMKERFRLFAAIVKVT
eukprot:jgi/Bigna1/81807/fgenesh1_pg.84_\